MEKGKPVAPLLAKLINQVCTTACDTDSIVSKYKNPENVNMCGPPTMNSEIWKFLDKRTHSNDKAV